MGNVETPCNRTCVLHPVLQLCIGCGRSLDEIARWLALTDPERADVMAQLPGRLASMRPAAAADAAATA
jgi:uncharacterized protein